MHSGQRSDDRFSCNIGSVMEELYLLKWYVGHKLSLHPVMYWHARPEIIKIQWVTCWLDVSQCAVIRFQYNIDLLRHSMQWLSLQAYNVIHVHSIVEEMLSLNITLDIILVWIINFIKRLTLSCYELIPWPLK